jgi:hypothetical protein
MSFGLEGLSRLIELVQPDPYWFTGSYESLGAVRNVTPIEGRFEFLRDESSVVISGEYRPGVNGQPRRIEVFFPFLSVTPHASKASIVISGTKSLTGAAFFRRDGVDLLCRLDDLCASAHLEVEASGTINVSGLITNVNSSLAYRIRSVSDKDRETLSNVVALPKRQSA